MKKLLFVWSFFFLTVDSISQVITVTWNSTKAYNCQGDKAKKPEFVASGTEVFNVPGNGKKELDLLKMESRFFEDGIHKNTLKIVSYQKINNNRIEIILEDFDLRTGQPLITYQILDLKNNISYYSWYYNIPDNITWVYIEYDGKIVLN